MEERLTTDQAVAGSSPATDAFGNLAVLLGVAKTFRHRELNPGLLGESQVF